MRQVAILFLSIVIFTQCYTKKQEIAQWRGPDRNGIFPETNLLTQWPDSGPTLVWKYDSLGQGYSSAVVTSKKVYTVGTIDSISYVFSFDTNGNLLWKKPLGKDWTKNWPGIRSTPVIYGDMGYVQTGLGVIYCFDSENGDVKWERDITKEFNVGIPEFGLCENLLVDDDRLFFTAASPDADVIALNRFTGELVWKTSGSNDSTSYTSPILVQIANKKYYINQTAKKLIAVDVKTGEIVWTYNHENHPFANTPIFRDGYLFAVNAWKAGSFKLKISDDGKSISEVWKDTLIDPQQGDMVLVGNRMYGATNHGRKFSCIDWETGKEIYSDSTKAQIINIISADSMLYCYELRGHVKLFKPNDNGFENRGSFMIKGGTRLHCSHPVIKDGKLFIRHDNSLFVYDIEKKSQSI